MDDALWISRNHLSLLATADRGMDLLQAPPAIKGGLTMAAKDLPWQIVGYVITGVLSFIASLIYTEFRTAPRRNVTLGACPRIIF